MKLIIISTPEASVPGEAAVLSRMVHAGIDTFHLRRPGWSLQKHEHFLRGLEPHVRRRIVLHHAHELVQPLQLKELELPLAGMAYAFLSPIFDSVSKAGYRAAFDRQALPAALSRAPCPVIALGGITAATIPQAAALGFAGAAVLGSVWESPNPVAECRKLLALCAALETAKSS